MKVKALLFFLFASFLMSCQPKFDGASESDFERSKKIVVEKLTADEKIVLEKALRVVALSAMYKKFNDSTLEGSSFSDISLKQIDGKSYKGVVEVAEDFLKEENARAVGRIQNEITEMENSKEKYLKLKSKLDVLEAKPVKIDLVDGWLVITCAFTNHSKEVINNYGTKISYSSDKDKYDGWNCSNVYSGVNEISPNETKLFTCKYDLESAKEKSKIILWDKIKFPITDFSKYNIVVDCKTDQVTLNGIDYELGRSEFDEEAEKNLLNKKEELKVYQAQKATLDELELTDE